MNSARLLTAAAVFTALLHSASSAQPSPPAPTAAPAAPSPAISNVGANINISPKRVILDRAHRTATVSVFNQGAAPGTFRISLVDRVMTSDGQILAVSEREKHPEMQPSLDRLRSAAQMVRVAPSRVTLAPGQSQTVKLQIVAPPEDTSAGEYRTHLTVTTVPPPSSGVTAEAAAAGNPNALSFQITTVFGLSIPAIVRVGELSVAAKIENARVETDGAAGAKQTVLVFDLVRAGANSLFGNIEVRPTGKRGELIGVARGVGVYPEIDRRIVRLPLNRAPAPGEHLEISFSDDDSSPGKLLATAVL